MNSHTMDVVAVVLLRDDGAALLQHRDNNPEINRPGIWGPPGGHCEPGEQLEESARREFFEETGYKLGEIRFLTRFIDDITGVTERVMVTVFWSVYDGIQEPVCHEGQALTFVVRERAVDLGVPVHLIQAWDRAIAARDSLQDQE